MGNKLYESYIKNYQKTPKGKYIRQRANAKRRDIPWDFTFETWWEVWEKSGKWEQRGRQPGQFVMSRINDEGHYSPSNVVIQPIEQNSIDSCEKRWILREEQHSTWEPSVPENNPYHPMHWKKFPNEEST